MLHFLLKAFDNYFQSRYTGYTLHLTKDLRYNQSTILDWLEDEK